MTARQRNRLLELKEQFMPVTADDAMKKWARLLNSSKDHALTEMTDAELCAIHPELEGMTDAELDQVASDH
jgi:hypothetical protein